jgi:1,2-diacylglycerol 3-beta-galactosyltransferase
VWAALYHATNSASAVALMRRSALRPVGGAVQRLLTSLHPAAVVSFHPLLNHLAAEAVRTSPSPDVPVITVITDLVDVHAGWACRDVDAVVIPSPGGLDRCRRAGIPAHRCHQLGLPVDLAFARPFPDDEERRVLRRRLGLAEDRFTALVCSGADGSGGLPVRARAIAGAGLRVGLAVICGRNRRASQRLEGLRDGEGRPVPVLGFVDNMADWMRAADVVVTKAGPGTITEALCSGLPMLLTWYIPGQERGNLEWVVDIGAGRYVPRTPELVDAIAELSVPGSPGLAAMRAAVAGAARPEATERIAALIAGMAGGSVGRR